MSTVRRPMMLGAFALAIGLMTAAGEVRAEEPPPRYMMVRCIKCPGGKGDAYRDYMLATTAKSMQVRANEGDINGWIFARAVIPSGEEAECDFVQMNLHKGFPPPSTPIDPWFKKAGLKLDRKEWYANLGPISKLVWLQLWRGVQSVGEVQKGNFVRLDMLKVAPARNDEWKRLQGEWQAAGRAALDQKLITAWQADELILPSGSGYRYGARRVTAFPDWTAIGQVPDDQALVRRVLKGKAPALLGREGRASELAQSALYEVVEVVRPNDQAVATPAPPDNAPAAPAAPPRKANVLVSPF
jgi:hypothetical protein